MTSPAWLALPALTILASRLLVLAYSRHAGRSPLAALGAVTALLAGASMVVGIGLLAGDRGARAPTGTGPQGASPLPLLGGVASLAVGAIVLAGLLGAVRRVRTPAGRLTVRPGDLLPELVAADEDGASVAVRPLLGPRGGLLVWYRGLT